MTGPKTLLVQLRSNATLTGAPLEGIRRKLKLASLYYDQLVFESGTLIVSAGLKGSTSFWIPPDDDGRNDHWQTPLGPLFTKTYPSRLATEAIFRRFFENQQVTDHLRRLVGDAEFAVVEALEKVHLLGCTSPKLPPLNPLKGTFWP